MSNIENLESALGRLKTNDSVVYFLTYDTKTTPRAAIKHIYDIALTLKQSGVDAKILAEDSNYSGVSTWLSDKYKDIPVVTIKDDKINIGVDDTIVVPEYYSNALQQLASVKCIKVMLVQQKDYIFENLPIGSRWSDFGFDRVITTTEASKKYIMEIFPESLVFIIPPIIDENFKAIELPQKPYVAISCRDRNVHRRLISEFYLKFPQLRWITFRDMVNMSYDDFATNLKECMVSLWVDDESTFGTFPLESMKCGVPVVGKVPNTEPEWIGENGMWTSDITKINELLGTYILAWVEGIELDEEVKQKINDTLLPYDTLTTKNNIISVFESLKNKRIEALETALTKLKQEEPA
jgi:glycosyltransferase involved in cell wall biosynthesis